MIDRMCIVGAGAVGSHVAARLARCGADVSLVARGAQLAAIAERGISLEAPDRNFTVRLPASDDPAALGKQDLVIVAVKGPSLPAAIGSILPLLKPETPIVYMMNGIPWWYFYREGGSRDGEHIEKLDPGGRIWAQLGPERALGGIVHSSSSIPRPGVVHVERAENRLVIGEPDNSDSRRAAEIVGILGAAGFTAETTTDIRRATWSKLILNIATGPLTVLSQSALADLYREDACVVEASRQCILESHAIADALGYGEGSPDIAAALKRFASSRHKPSILQDLEASRAMEIDAIYGVPLDFAREAGVATPLLSLLVALTKVRARSAGLYAG